MQAYYINLPQEAQRRDVLERNFSRFAPPGWTLHRVSAVNAQDVLASQVPGRITGVEKACYLSHAKALAMACEHPQHAYILEDDAHFGPRSFQMIGRALDQLEREGNDWDLLYTQVMPVCPEHMVELLRIRSQCVRENQFAVVNTRNMILAGACSYLVQAKSKHKVLGFLQSQNPIDTPVDGLYWRLAREGQLQARVVFPLASSVSPEATVSQIQSSSKALASLIWNAWMRLSAYDRDLDAIEQSLHGLPPLTETPAQAQALLQPLLAHLEPQEARIMQTLLSHVCAKDFRSLFTVLPEPKPQPESLH